MFRHVNAEIQSALVRKEDIAAFKELYVERGIIRNPVFKIVKGFHRRHKRKIFQNNERTTDVYNRITLNRVTSKRPFIA